MTATGKTMTRAVIACATVLVVVAVGRSPALPPGPEELKRQEQLAHEVKAAFTADRVPPGTAAALARRLEAEPNPDVRRGAFASLPPAGGRELDAFLTEVLAADPDAGIRGLAAGALGRVGTEKCLPALAKAAAADPTTFFRFGCIGGQSSARRAATFALAELATRFPKLADQAAAELRALTPPADPKDGEGLADARVQALYQVTRDEKLLAPFVDRLRSKDAKVRGQGAIAFRFFKLKTAPPELVAALRDPDADVRSCAQLALGEIGDPKTVPALMGMAGDAGADTRDRFGVIHALGQMRAKAAADLMRKLLDDENEGVRTAAAIALYRITGEKTKPFPPGYNAD